VGSLWGLFFGLALGLGGIGSALLGAMADRHGIPFVFLVMYFLPLIGLFSAVLAKLGRPRRAASTAGTA
jgi:FSR family fosmidomycin resistance protein-like MFS transporter